MRARILPYARIQAQAKACGLGVVDIEPIWRQAGVARYVAKYMSNALDTATAGERLFGLTPGHNLPKNPDWHLLRPGGIPLWMFQPSGVALILHAPMYAIPPPTPASHQLSAFVGFSFENGAQRLPGL
jgi:hypothetical protein